MGERGTCLGNFSRPERGRTQKSLPEVLLVLVFFSVLRRRLVAAPPPLTEAALGQSLPRCQGLCH